MLNEQDTDDKRPKGKKQIFLKQYLVSGSRPGARNVEFGAAILHTCSKLAAEEFRKRFPDLVVWGTDKTADSDLTKEDMKGRDFWAEKNNWIWFDRRSATA